MLGHTIWLFALESQYKGLSLVSEACNWGGCINRHCRSIYMALADLIAGPRSNALYWTLYSRVSVRFRVHLDSRNTWYKKRGWNLRSSVYLFYYLIPYSPLARIRVIARLLASFFLGAVIVCDAARLASITQFRLPGMVWFMGHLYFSLHTVLPLIILWFNSCEFLRRCWRMFLS